MASQSSSELDEQEESFSQQPKSPNTTKVPPKPNPKPKHLPTARRSGTQATVYSKHTVVTESHSLASANTSFETGNRQPESSSPSHARLPSRALPVQKPPSMENSSSASQEDFPAASSPAATVIFRTGTEELVSKTKQGKTRTLDTESPSSSRISHTRVTPHREQRTRAPDEESYSSSRTLDARGVRPRDVRSKGNRTTQERGPRPRNSGSSQKVKFTDTEATAGTDDTAARFPIIYKLAAQDMETKQMINRYSTTPFEGLYDRKGMARENLSVIDVLYVVLGTGLDKQKKNQTREDLGTTKFRDDGPFKVGEHIYSRTTPRATFRIMSARLFSLLKQVVRYYPGYDFNIKDKEPTIDEPYRVLFHHYEDLCKIRDCGGSGSQAVFRLRNEVVESTEEVDCDETSSNVLKILLGCSEFQKFYAESILPELSLYEAGQASYKNLWLLYKPGNIVLTDLHKRLTAFIVSEAKHEESKSRRSCWSLRFWNLVFNGKRLTRQA